MSRPFWNILPFAPAPLLGTSFFTFLCIVCFSSIDGLTIDHAAMQRELEHSPAPMVGISPKPKG